MKRELLEQKIKSLRLTQNEYTGRNPAREVAEDIAADPCSRYYEDSKRIGLRSILLNIDRLRSQKNKVEDLVISKLGKDHKLTMLVTLLFEDIE